MSKMIEVSAIVQNEYKNNLFFKSDMPQITPNNIHVPRDDENFCFKNFRKILSENQININTYDLVDEKKVDLEIYFHFNTTKKNCKKIRYCVWPEAPEIFNRNNRKQLEKDFNKVFTTFDEDIDNKKFFKIKYPINFKTFNINGYSDRPHLFCILSSNKNLSQYSKKSGYIERVKLIKWFEKNYPSELSLYGVGWDKYFSSNYFLNRYFSKLINKFYKKNMSVYNGIATSKSEVYQKHKFSFCYENVFDKPGYFCELLFDSFNNGCVPVYRGCSNILDYIPENSFIDLRNFKNNQEIFNFIKKMKENEYIDYQLNIKKFLDNEKNKTFSIEFFSNQIIKHIKKDFSL